MVQNELYQKNLPDIRAPFAIRAQEAIARDQKPPRYPTLCRMFNSFDFSRCSILSKFPVYLYENVWKDTEETEAVQSYLYPAFKRNPHVTTNPQEACLYVLIVNDRVRNIEAKLSLLPYWNGDGRNHLLIDLSPKNTEVNAGRAIIAKTQYKSFEFRQDFDILTPPLIGRAHGNRWQGVPPLVPARRKFFLSFQGELPSLQQHLREADRSGDARLREELDTIKELTKLTNKFSGEDKFYLHFSCRGSGTSGDPFEWQLCGNENQRVAVRFRNYFVAELSRSTRTYVRA